MKILSSLSLLTVKVTLLGCFSFMGWNTVSAAPVPPCHNQVQAAAEDQDPLSCDACEIAKKAWSSDLIMSDTTPELEDMEEPAQATALPLAWTASVIDFRILRNTSPPPDNFHTAHLHLLAQKTILLLI